MIAHHRRARFHEDLGVALSAIFFAILIIVEMTR